MSENTGGELAREVVESLRLVVERRDERVDGGSGVGTAVHVSNMNLVKRSFANAKHKGTSLLKADIGRALDQVAGDAVGNPGQSSDAARNDDHGVAGIGAAGNVGADIVVGLHVDLARSVAEKLANEIAAALQAKLFCHDAQGAVGSDEIDGLDAIVLVDSGQKFAQEEGTAGAGRGHGQVGWRGLQRVSDGASRKATSGLKF